MIIDRRFLARYARPARASSSTAYENDIA